MKMNCKSKSISIKYKRNQDRSVRWLNRAVITSAILIVLGLTHDASAGEGTFGLDHQHGAAGAGASCQLTTQAAARSCRQSALSDFWIATGTCDNLSDASARKDCKAEALADQKDAMQSCGEQRDAREAACDRLGGGPYDPEIDPANFVDKIDNPWFPLTPGTTYIYEGQTAQGLVHNEVAVTSNTREILGVPCVEVHDTVKIDGQLTEDTLDWYSQDKDGNVWYFGENSKELDDNLVVSLEGSWTAGEDGAKPGIIMEAAPAIGDFYRQEFSLGTAEDLAEVTGLNASVDVPYDSYTQCLETRETASLEPDALEYKYFCKDVGNVLTNDITAGEVLPLVSIIPPSP